MNEHHDNERASAAMRERSRRRAGNVYSIDPGTAFLPALADFLLDQHGADHVRLADDPIRLSQSIVFLPTRRAAKGFGLALQSSIERRTGRQATLLPRIATLGDADEAELLDGIAFGAMDDAAMLAASLERDPVPDNIERMLLLGRLTKGWTQTLTRHSLDLLGEADRVLPSSSADALWLAGDLAGLMDQMETEEIGWDAIGDLVPQDRQEWWQLTIGFLEIVTKSWPQVMAEKGFVSPAALRRQLSDLRIAQLVNNPPNGVVLAAGSTGSIPTTARLLTTIAGLENGRVVLPGLDGDLPDAVISALRDDPENATEAVRSTHAQFGLCRLLARLQVQNADVQHISSADDGLVARGRVLSGAMLPAEATEQWFRLRNELGVAKISQGLEGVALIEAPDDRAEALAIALALRETLDTPGKLAALVTPDRNLAKRVSAELERFDIGIDDSAGTPITATPVYRFVRAILCAAMAKDAGGEETLMQLAELLHQPLLFDGGLQPISGVMDVAALREARPAAIITTLTDALEAMQRSIAEPGHHAAVLRSLDETTWSWMIEAARQLQARIRPLVDLLDVDEPVSPQALGRVLLATASDLSSPLDAAPGPSQDGEAVAPARNPAGMLDTVSLFDQSGGVELRAFLERLAVVADTGFTFKAAEAVAVFDALTAGLVVREAVRTHPRLFILGTLEARLQRYDRVVLGGLNEGTWPSGVTNDPFLNRPMRAELSLPLPERRIGLAAHDFAQLSGAQDVIYTRSLRSGGPTVASRWLQRLSMFIGDAHTEALQQRGARYLQIAEAIDSPEQSEPALARTRATPPIAARPRDFSITEIETLIRDPYAIYAKHVLALRALPPLLADNEAATRGSIYHRVVERFTRNAHDTILNGDTTAAFAAMMRILDEELTGAVIAPEIAGSWRQRFEGIANQFIEWEIARAGSIVESHVEVALPKTPIAATGFTLRGRADRIDINSDGALQVFDYKTTKRPSAAEARTIAPQLALTAAFASAGHFEGVASGEIDRIAHLRLRNDDKFEDPITSGKSDDKRTAPQIARDASDRLVGLVTGYDDEHQPYWSQLIPDAQKRYKGDYDYLARIKEWSIGAGDEDGVEDQS